MRIIRIAAVFLSLCLLPMFHAAQAAETVPTDVQIPGTQPLGVDNPPDITSVGNCGCHGNYSGNPRPEDVPEFGWAGGMMANAGRDPLFWSTVAIAEQDFDGVGDLCLHCHSVKGWIEGRSTPTDGSGLDPSTDGEGIMCEFCHLLTNPDQANTIPNPPEGSYVEEQHAPFLAHDAAGDGYYGGAQYVLNSGGTRLGPYTDHEARHDAIPSAYHRDARLCGTCHDVSNPAVGDLAHNHGSISPFTGAFSGVLGGPVADKAAMNNPPASYGVVERTFSEWVGSLYDTLAVNGFGGLDAEMQTAGGALERAYLAALNGTCSASGDPCKSAADCGGGETCDGITADYADGTPRYYTCQTCHMSATLGKGAKQASFRGDLPGHDQTGGSYWVADAVKYQDDNGTLIFGGGLTTDESAALTAGQQRAKNQLRSAARLAATVVGDELEVRVTNLTGHKLISGYPEGRRMWLRLTWKDGIDSVVKVNGEYGPIGPQLLDDQGSPMYVESILSPASTKVYEAKPALTQEWAAVLASLGATYENMVLDWDRLDHSPGMTMGQLAAEPPGTLHPTFHFVLNNAVYKDNRIPPLGFDYDTAVERNTLPIPTDQYGAPPAGGTYEHYDLVRYPIPPDAESVEVELLYQSTSWEYIQFLWQANDGTGHLGQEGVNMLEAWLNATDASGEYRMSAPYEMAEITVTGLSGLGVSRVPGEATQLLAEYDATTGEIRVSYAAGCDAADHTIYYGDLANVASYAYSGARCYVGVDGSAGFDPQLDNVFFLIAANDADVEGSYGLGAAGERPEHTGTLLCDYPQNLTGATCP